MKRHDAVKLAELLRSIFQKDELRRFMMLHYKEIHDGIRWEDTHRMLTAEVAAAFERHGHIDDGALKAALKAERPRRSRDIAELRRTRRMRPAVMLGALALGGGAVVERGLHGWPASSEPAAIHVREDVRRVQGEEGQGEGVQDAMQVEAMMAERMAATSCPADMVLVVPDPRLYRGEPPFCLDIHEVSRGSYGLACPPVGPGDGAAARQCELATPDPRWRDYPMVQVTAGEARSFCQQQGRRLPTHREHRIAQAMDADFRALDELLPTMNLCGTECRKPPNASPFVFKHADPHSQLAPVGSFGDRFPSRLGVADLVGNAREIVLRGEAAVACGGSWQSYDKHALSPERCDDTTALSLEVRRYADVGFRCARDASAEM